MIVGDCDRRSAARCSTVRPSRNPGRPHPGVRRRHRRAVWIFHTVPRSANPASRPGKNESWKYTGNTNAWTMFSADHRARARATCRSARRRTTTTAATARATTCTRRACSQSHADSGKLVWHFQGVHHGLVGLRLSGRADAGRHHGRRHGASRPSRRSASRASPTCSIARPASRCGRSKSARCRSRRCRASRRRRRNRFRPSRRRSREQGLTVDDLIDFTPEMRAEALKIASEYTLGPLFTPPTVVGENGKKGMLQMPSACGRRELGRRGFDPELGYLFLQSSNICSLGGVVTGDTATQQSAYTMRSVGWSARARRSAADQATVRRRDGDRPQQGRNRVASRARRRPRDHPAAQGSESAAAGCFEPHVPVERRAAGDEDAAVRESGADAARRSCRCRRRNSSCARSTRKPARWCGNTR